MYKNHIIALSGMPVSGKGSTVKKLIRLLQEKGITEDKENKKFEEENIHLIATGDQFRKYFGAVEKIVKSEGNIALEEAVDMQDENMKELFKKKDFQEAIMKTIIKLKETAEQLDKISIKDANDSEGLKEIREIIDEQIDGNIKKMGEKIKEEDHPNEIWIVDSRLAFHNIPEAFAVRLTVEPDIAGERTFNDANRGKEDKYATVDEATEAAIARTEGEVKRYKERYGVDLENEENYNLIIDTSYADITENAETILTCYERDREGRYFGKQWTSPRKLLPSQRERDTLGKNSHIDINQLRKDIKENGYDPSEDIMVVSDKKGRNYIIDGHLRNFGAALSGKTLVPYIVMAKDDGSGSKESVIAHSHINRLDVSYLIGHEWMINEKFSYKKMYPDIFGVSPDIPVKGEEEER